LQLTRSGEELSRDINQQLAGAVEAAHSISNLTDEISAATSEQAVSIDRISQSVAQINQVTRKNADSAAKSSEAAQELENQVYKLTAMVRKFNLDPA
jgi:methyl-accepting chemotaxis protein